MNGNMEYMNEEGIKKRNKVYKIIKQERKTEKYDDVKVTLFRFV
jgi:hypothetical protein